MLFEERKNSFCLKLQERSICQKLVSLLSQEPFLFSVAKKRHHVSFKRIMLLNLLYALWLSISLGNENQLQVSWSKDHCCQPDCNPRHSFLLEQTSANAWQERPFHRVCRGKCLHKSPEGLSPLRSHKPWTRASSTEHLSPTALSVPPSSPHFPMSLRQRWPISPLFWN